MDYFSNTPRQKYILYPIYKLAYIKHYHRNDKFYDYYEFDVVKFGSRFYSRIKENPRGRENVKSTTELEKNKTNKTRWVICADERKTRADGYTQHSEGISRVQQRRFDGACNEFKHDGGLKKKKENSCTISWWASRLYAGYRRSHNLLPSSKY